MNGPFYECSQTRELSEAKAKMIPYFNAFLEVKQWDMNDLQATTFTNNGWLAYMVKAVD